MGKFIRLLLKISAILKIMKISEHARSKLKKPLGKVHKSLETIKSLSKKYRIISVGDICTLALLCIGVRPHLAVFDFKYMRQALPQGMASILKREFKNIKTIENKAGTISEALLKNAKTIIKNGGALHIVGEEDLTALVFIKNASEKEIIVYGQPNEGIVVVRPDKKTKKFIDSLLIIRPPHLSSKSVRKQKKRSRQQRQ